MLLLLLRTPPFLNFLHIVNFYSTRDQPEVESILEAEQLKKFSIKFASLKTFSPEVIVERIKMHDASQFTDQQLIIIKDLMEGISEEQKNSFVKDTSECKMNLVCFFRFACLVKNITWMTKALIFERTFDSEFKAISSQICMLEETLKEIRNSEKLKKLLLVARHIGNLANVKYGRQSNIYETFPIESLILLKDVKSLDKNLTIVQYLVSKIRNDDQFKDILHLKNDMPDLNSIRSIDADYLYGQVRTLEASFKEVSQVETSLETNDFQKNQKAFLEEARNKVAKVVKQSSDTQALWDDVVKYLTLDSAWKPSNLLETLDGFLGELEKAERELVDSSLRSRHRRT